MTDATRLWSIWQAPLEPFHWAFTRPGHRRFAEWVTALAINAEEHTVTQSVLALDRPADWRAMERFAEYKVQPHKGTKCLTGSGAQPSDGAASAR